MSKTVVSRIILIAITSLGFFASARLSLAHFNSGEVCPMIGPLPACYVVSLGYFLMLVAGLLSWLPKRQHIFYLGWVPVILLAVTGVGFEILRGNTCPSGRFGIPQCFYSLAMAALCWALFHLSQNKRLNSF